jgi:hypothetical protein
LSSLKREFFSKPLAHSEFIARKGAEDAKYSMGKLESRNPKFETNLNDQKKQEFLNKLVWGFRNSDLSFSVCFGFRYSDFGFDSELIARKGVKDAKESRRYTSSRVGLKSNIQTCNSSL